MNNINLILRGYLKKNNYQPKSKRKKTIEKYDIDFLEYSYFYERLLNQLKKKYKVNLFFATYDTTPTTYLNEIKNKFDPQGIFLSQEIDSTQFSTTCDALQDKYFKETNNLTFILRSDILMTDLFISKLCDYEFKNKSKLYTTCQDQGQQGNVLNHVDIFHACHSDVLKNITEWMCKGYPNAHFIYKYFECEPLFNIKEYNWLKGEGWYDYIDKGLIKALYSTWSGVNDTWYINQKYKDYKESL
jgi:hypothetical protein